MNSVNDRETPDYTAMDYIDTVANILRHYDVPPPLQTSPDDVIPWETASFITHVAYLEGAEVPVDEAAMQVGDNGSEGDADADNSGTGYLRCAHPATCARDGTRSGADVLREDGGVGDGAGRGDAIEHRVHTCMDNGQWTMDNGATLPRCSREYGAAKGEAPLTSTVIYFRPVPYHVVATTICVISSKHPWTRSDSRFSRRGRS